MGRRDQRVDGQQAERRRAVDDDVAVVLSERASLSFSRNGASSSPTSRDSSLASAMRAGAIDRFGSVVGRMMLASWTDGSTKTSYMLFVD